MTVSDTAPFIHNYNSLSCVYYPHFTIKALKIIERLKKKKWSTVIQLGSGRARICTEIRPIPKFIL